MLCYVRYYNAVPVDKRVFKNVKLFMESKKDGDDLFDRLNTSVSLTPRSFLYSTVSIPSFYYTKSQHISKSHTS